MAEGGVGRLDCTICLEKFTKPKLLPCYHTFCAGCLEKFIERNSQHGKFYCPLCRKCTDIPSSGVESFQTNFYIETDEAKIGDDPVPCDGCGPENTADHRCIDCEENLCPNCTKAHMNLKVTRNHRLMEIQASNLEVRRKIKTKVFCQTHPTDEIRVVCKQCQELLCVVCMLTKHHGHQSVEVKDEASAIRSELASTLHEEKTKEHDKIISDEIATLKGENVQLTNGLAADKRELKKQVGKIHAAVDRLAVEKQKKLTEIYEKAWKVNQEHLDKLETERKSWASLINTTTHFFDQETDVGLVKEGRRIRQQISHLRDGYVNLHGHVLLHNEGQYHLGGIDCSMIGLMIGDVGTESGRTKSTQTRVQKIPTPMVGRLSKISSFVVQLGVLNNNIFGISPAGNDNVWISGYKNKVILCNSAGNVLLSRDVKGYCLTTDKDGNCIAACPDQRIISRVTTAGDVDIIISNIPTPPYGIAYRQSESSKEELVFCCKDKVYMAPYQVGGKITELSSGDSNAVDVAVDQTSGNICIVDYSQKDNVTILNKTGELVAKYQDKDFTSVFGACYDSEGCVLVISLSSHEIRRLRPDGTLMEILPKDTSSTGFRMCVDKDNRLWIGGENGHVNVYKIST